MLKFPNLIYNEKGLDITLLFLFQFGRNFVKDDEPNATEVEVNKQEEKTQRISKYTFEDLIKMDAEKNKDK